ncbi:hypothetical protein KTO58_01995 [Chitinophaga pendula]|uniref:hypothetical protein n=1 Tax=Chitinophaga TaxID=79328 RepID=UPI000BAEC3F6|nr:MULTISPECIES: hypothetical protein [Chitinophaga]ASZ14374.1 hypothetical protein CK934_27230 [Chitinophaga sp. MD30]UCJ07974.1 hypothetical protein KTO58_01995 [Chitinophaga pendula]
MKHIAYLSLLLLTAACQTSDNKTPKHKNAPAVTPKTPATTHDTHALPAVIKGERIDGPANIRSSATGPVLFSLDDNVLVECTNAQKGWYQVGLNVDLSKNEAANQLIKAGSILKVKGKPVGKALKNLKAYAASSNEGTFATIDGFTQVNNIKSASIIETALTSFLTREHSRTFAATQPFIKQFALEKEQQQFAPFTIYFNYENAIDDPSPLYRLALVFRNNMLLGIVHTRPINIKEATVNRLDRGFEVSWLPGSDKKQQNEFAKAFNLFINAVD